MTNDLIQVRVIDLVGKPVEGLVMQVRNIEYVEPKTGVYIERAERKFRKVRSVKWQKLKGSTYDWLMIHWTPEADENGHFQTDCGNSGMAGKKTKEWKIEMYVKDYIVLFDKLDFNNYADLLWPRANELKRWEGSQGTGLKRAHSLRHQLSKDYLTYLRSKKLLKNDLFGTH